MLYVEVCVNTDLVALKTQITEAYTARTLEVAPRFEMAEVIIWDGRLWQRIEFREESPALEYENALLQCSLLRMGRLQVGTMNGEVFLTPPEDVMNMAARVVAGGDSVENVIYPFRCSPY